MRARRVVDAVPCAAGGAPFARLDASWNTTSSRAGASGRSRVSPEMSGWSASYAAEVRRRRLGRGLVGSPALALGAALVPRRLPGAHLRERVAGGLARLFDLGDRASVPIVSIAVAVDNLKPPPIACGGGKEIGRSLRHPAKFEQGGFTSRRRKGPKTLFPGASPGNSFQGLRPRKLVAMQYRVTTNIVDYRAKHQREFVLARLQKPQCSCTTAKCPRQLAAEVI
jgi:hypothetical protein